MAEWGGTTCLQLGEQSRNTDISQLFLSGEKSQISSNLSARLSGLFLVLLPCRIFLSS